MTLSQTDVLMVEHVLTDGNRFHAHVPVVSMAIYAKQVNLLYLCNLYQQAICLYIYTSIHISYTSSMLRYEH